MYSSPQNRVEGHGENVFKLKALVLPSSCTLNCASSGSRASARSEAKAPVPTEPPLCSQQFFAIAPGLIFKPCHCSAQRNGRVLQHRVSLSRAPQKSHQQVLDSALQGAGESCCARGSSSQSLLRTHRWEGGRKRCLGWTLQEPKHRSFLSAPVSLVNGISLGGL